MFEYKTHNSFILFSFSLVMLVMTCVGVTTLIDSRAGWDTLEHKVSEQRQKIMSLEQVARSLEAKRDSADFLARIEQGELDILETRKHVLLATRTNLRSDQRHAAAELETVEKEFGAYQDKARKLIWSRSVGYRLGSLTIENDRTYEDVAISEISEHGVKIVHDGGTSLIPSSSMPTFLQEKFQLVIAPYP